MVASVEDITERKRVEIAEKDQRILATALVETAEAINSTLNFNEVLDRILDTVGRVIPHDGANIMLIGEDMTSVETVRYCDCYEKHGLEKPSMEVRPLNTFPHFEEMATTGQGVLIKDTSTDEHWIR